MRWKEIVFCVCWLGFLNHFASSWGGKTNTRPTRFGNQVLPLSKRDITPTRRWVPLNRLNQTFTHFPGWDRVLASEEPYGENGWQRRLIFRADHEGISSAAIERSAREASLRAAIIDGSVDPKEVDVAFDAFLNSQAVQQADVLQANTDFYAYLAVNDLAGLRSLWLTPEDAQRSNLGPVVCLPLGSASPFIGEAELTEGIQRIHPLVGARWQRVALHFWGDVAIVTNQLRIPVMMDESSPGIITNVTAHALNVFVRPVGDTRYSLLAHIAHALPPDTGLPDFRNELKNTYRDPRISSSTEHSLPREFGEEFIPSSMELPFGVSMDGSSAMGGGDMNRLMQILMRNAQGAPSMNPKLVVLRMKPPPSMENSDLTTGVGASSPEEVTATLVAIQWLHSEGRLSSSEKKLLTTVVLDHVTHMRPSRVQIAYRVLVGENGGPEVSAAIANRDLSTLPPEGILEFELVCRLFARQISPP